MKIEEYSGTLKNKKQVYSFIDWKESETGFELHGEPIRKWEIEHNLDFNGIVISVGENKFIGLPEKAWKYYHTGSSDDNFHTKGLDVIRNYPDKVYIDLKQGLTDLEKNTNLYKPFYISVFDTEKEKEERYYIVVSLEVKNNGDGTGRTKHIKSKVYINKVLPSTYITNAINISFYSFLLIGFFNTDFSILQSYLDYPNYIFESGLFGVGLIATYLTKLYFNSICYRNTWLNTLYKKIMRQSNYNLNEKEVIKRLDSLLNEKENKIKKEKEDEI